MVRFNNLAYVPWGYLMNELPIKRDWRYGISACVLFTAMALCIIGAVTSLGVRSVLEQHPMAGDWTWPTIILADLLTFTMTAYLCSEPLVQLRTRFTDEGIIRQRWFQPHSMRWQDVQEVDDSFVNNVKVVSETHTISINLYLFKEPSEVLQIIKTRVRPEAVLSDEQIAQRIFLYHLDDARQRFLLLTPSGLSIGIVGFFFWAPAVALGCLAIISGLVDGYRWMRLRRQAK